MRITNNFDIDEFKCPCCNKVPEITEDFKLFVNMLQKLRDLYGDKIVITSGFRCKRHNSKVGGASDSAHLKGLACDILCTTAYNRLKMVAGALNVGFSRIGIGNTFIHLDIDKAKSNGIWLYK